MLPACSPGGAQLIRRRDALSAGAAFGRLAMARPLLADGPSPPTIEALTRPAEFSGPALSPDGQHLASLKEKREGGKRVAFLDIVATATPQSVLTRRVLGDYNIESVAWANNERILAWVYVEQGAKYTST